MFQNLSQDINSKFDVVKAEMNSFKHALLGTKRNMEEHETSVTFNGDKIMAIEKETLPKMEVTFARKNRE